MRQLLQEGKKINKIYDMKIEQWTRERSVVSTLCLSLSVSMSKFHEKPREMRK